MVDYYYLLNQKVPEEIWLKITKDNQYVRPLKHFDEQQIIADVEDTIELRNFIGCLLDLLERGYRYNVDFEFSTAS